MTFIDDPMYAKVRAIVYGEDHDSEDIFRRHGILARTGVDEALDAIPDGWAKLDGRFVRIEAFGVQPRSAEHDRYYRVVEDSR